MGVDLTTLTTKYPKLYHMAAPGSWPGIFQHGLLSTSRLLRLFEVEEEQRRSLESAHRRQSVEIVHPVHGRATLRDQCPMDDAGLRRALPPEISPADWYRTLNEKVFFWVCEKRLHTFMSARAYRSQPRVLLTLDARRLLEAYADAVLLCPINSGATKPYPRQRDYSSFLPLAQYPWSHWESKRRGKDTVVEVAITGGVPNLREFVIRVEEVDPSGDRREIFRP